MTPTELCQWLRDNSSGIYRPAAEAADLIEAQARENAELRRGQAIMARLHLAEDRRND